MAAKNKTCECSFCGEKSPVRLLDRDGYAPDEFICEECFSDDCASWDDLPKVKERARNMGLLEDLKYLRENGPVDEWQGICDNTDCDMKQLFKKWPKFSGDDVYPIPNPSGGSPSDAYLLTEDVDMWNPDHPYGALRLELLDWMIEQLSEEHNETA